ncbi:hypothetical protein [uncultured Desulfobacter sp.]|nr:hypothetical protein [uncultured Desulfobacter sp.]
MSETNTLILIVDDNTGMCSKCGDRLYGKEPWYIQMKKESKESF